MSKGIEAIKELRYIVLKFCEDNNKQDDYCIELCDIIEKELQRLEAIYTTKPSEALEETLKELTLYKDFAKLFFDVFELKYENDKFTLTLKPYEQYNIENIDLKVCIIKKDADKILKVAELLESEVNDND